MDVSLDPLNVGDRQLVSDISAHWLDILKASLNSDDPQKVGFHSLRRGFSEATESSIDCACFHLDQIYSAVGSLRSFGHSRTEQDESPGF